MEHAELEEVKPKLAHHYETSQHIEGMQCLDQLEKGGFAFQCRTSKQITFPSTLW
jgi:hypothetical protein